MFCPKCGSILLPRKEDKKSFLACSCGYRTSKLEGPTLIEKVAKSDAIEVIDKREFETLPKTKVKCSKCTNKEAYYWLVQTRAGDEPETKFLRCTKCNHTWRDYS